MAPVNNLDLRCRNSKITITGIRTASLDVWGQNSSLSIPLLCKYLQQKSPRLETNKAALFVMCAAANNRKIAIWKAEEILAAAEAFTQCYPAQIRWHFLTPNNNFRVSRMETIPHNAQIWFNGYALQRETNKKTWDASVFLLVQSDVTTAAKTDQISAPSFFFGKRVHL